MKIAYICTDLGIPVFGYKGCSIHVQEVIRSFLSQGAEVTLFTPRLGGKATLDLQGVKVVQLPMVTSKDPAQREIFSQNLNSDIMESLTQSGLFDLIYERYSLWSYAAMEFAKAEGVPGILEVNAPLIEEQSRHRQLINVDEARKTSRRAFSAASALIAVSGEVASYLDRYEETNGRVQVIGNGVNPARFQWPSAPKVEKNFTIGFVGTLKPWHGIDGLIEAFALLHRKNSNARLLIVGDGPKRSDLEQQLYAHNLTEAAHFTGAVPPDLIPELLATMDVAVAPYPDNPDFYFSPLKVLEYMAAGLPVVASRIGQLNSLIQHKRNGLLYQPGETSALMNALEQLNTNPALRKTLGHAARQTVTDRHSWYSVTQRILNLANLSPSKPIQSIHQTCLNQTSQTSQLPG